MTTPMRMPVVAWIVIIGAALTVMLTGMRAASPLLGPLLLALAIGIIAAPHLEWLRRKGLPAWLATLIIIIELTMVLGALAIFLTISVQRVASLIPQLQTQLVALQASVFSWFEARGMEMPAEISFRLINPREFVAASRAVAGLLTNSLSSMGVVLLFSILFLFELPVLTKKLAKLHAEGDSVEQRVAEYSHLLQRYFVISTINNLFCGVSTYFILVIIGVEFALLWAVLTFLLSYIPTVGQVIATIPPALLALLTLGFNEMVYVIIGMTAVNLIGNNVIVPRMSTSGLNISILVVFLSLLIWGWVFGLLGALLAIPLTLALKSMLEIDPRTQWLANLLTSRSSDERKGESS